VSRREPLLSVQDLHVWFDLAAGTELHAVQGVSFDLRPGERLASPDAARPPPSWR
jgi:ABC-type glutathione transport system ATPase component